MYICPKCSTALSLCGNSYKCVSGHSYDVSASGYVNLLLGSKRGVHGDNKEMITARREFLRLGHYFPIVATLSSIIEQSKKTDIRILDAGCGEGYYTAALKKALSDHGINAEIYAIDVSKDAVMLASKSHKDISFSVASINALPFRDRTFDYVLSLFAPLCEEEFSRVLTSDGVLITVSPSENHLFGLKAAIYDTPYKNPPSTFENKILHKTSEISDEWEITLDRQEDIENLFKMTPYYYNTGAKGVEKACSLTSLTTVIGFAYGVYKNRDVSENRFKCF